MEISGIRDKSGNCKFITSSRGDSSTESNNPPVKRGEAMKNYHHKGWLIVPREDTPGQPVYLCYTPEEAEYPAALRTSAEWEACSLQEARDFIDGYGRVAKE